MLRKIICINALCEYHETGKGFDWDDFGNVYDGSETVKPNTKKAGSIQMCCPNGHMNILWFNQSSIITLRRVVDLGKNMASNADDSQTA